MLKVNLWEVRTAKGLKLEAVAVMTGVSKSTLNNIEMVKLRQHWQTWKNSQRFRMPYKRSVRFRI